MKINNLPLSWYVDKLNNDEPFSLGHYGDGEWQAIFRRTIGCGYTKNCEGTLYGDELSDQMAESLKYNHPNFYFASPNTFKKVPEYFVYEVMADKVMKDMGVDIEFVEKNIWNEAMYKAELYPLIKALRNKNLCIIGNKNLRLLTFLGYDNFIEIGYPNCFTDGTLAKAYNQAVRYGQRGVFLVAAGIPATLLVQKLHSVLHDSWVIDMGSIWDGFVGIGGQRPTRREFYKHPETWKEWRDKNLQEIPWEINSVPVVEWYGMGSKEINPNL
jgi:hypothetical protein